MADTSTSTSATSRGFVRSLFTSADLDARNFDAIRARAAEVVQRVGEAFGGGPAAAGGQ